MLKTTCLLYDWFAKIFNSCGSSFHKGSVLKLSISNYDLCLITFQSSIVPVVFTSRLLEPGVAAEEEDTRRSSEPANTSTQYTGREGGGSDARTLWRAVPCHNTSTHTCSGQQRSWRLVISGLFLTLFTSFSFFFYFDLLFGSIFYFLFFYLLPIYVIMPLLSFNFCPPCRWFCQLSRAVLL